MTLCPVCHKEKPAQNMPVCTHCMQNFRAACLLIATHINDLYAVATKQAKVDTTTSDIAPITNFPLKIRAYEIYTTITALVDTVATAHKLTFPPTRTYRERLLIIRNAPVLDSPTFARDMLGFMALAKEMRTILTPQPERKYIGACFSCHASVWADITSELTACQYCGHEIDVRDLQAHTLRSLYNSQYTATITELVAWLQSWGIKVSKRSIQRWCTEGRLHTRVIDKRGTQQFKIGEVIKQIKLS